MNLITLREAMAMFRLSREFLYRGSRRGEIPSYRCGSALRFDPEELRKCFKKAAKRKGAR